MFNVTVIRLKDLIKYPVVIIISMIIIYFTTRYFFYDKKIDIGFNVGKEIEKKINMYLLYPIKEEFAYIEKNEKIENLDKIIDENINTKDKQITTSLLKKSFELQFGKIRFKDNDIKTSKNNEKTTDNKETKNKGKKEKSNIITKNPIQETYTINYKGVKIRNGTNYNLTDKDLNPKNLKINPKNIIIFHTHTCESYTQSEKYKYKPTGNYRTTDLKYSVARVGDELTNYLKKYKLNVNHDKTYHDYPEYNGSYSRSLKTVTNLLKKQKTDIIIDLHRDAIGSNSKYDPTVKIGKDECAQLMFVMGTNRWWT